MKWPVNWNRPKVVAQETPRDGGRSELLTTTQDIDLMPGIPRGIRRDFSDITHGTITAYGGVEWPPYADDIALVHMRVPRGMIAARLGGKNIDDNVQIPSMFVGNPQG